MLDKLFDFIAWLHGDGKDSNEVCREWHSFVQGFCEVICPWPPRHKEMAEELELEIQGEHHYYVFGRACGLLAWVGIIALFKAVLT